MLPQLATSQGASQRKHKAAPAWACLGLSLRYTLKMAGFPVI